MRMAPNCERMHMATNALTIRAATPADAAELLAIYAFYVENTAITFEYDVPSVEEFARRIAGTLEKYPYLVAESSDGIQGYAYVGQFHVRPAYDWAVETSVYVRRDGRTRGTGRALYDALEKVLAVQGVLNLEACIAYAPVEDEYLTNNSVGFHDHMGYRMVGGFEKCGFKFNRWYDMVWMEKLIGEHRADQPPVRWFPQVASDLENILNS